MTNKEFDKKVRDAMRGYGETPPSGLYDRIEQTLADMATDSSAASKRGAVKRLYRYASVAAAVAAALLTTLYFIGRGVTEDLTLTAESSLNTSKNEELRESFPVSGIRKKSQFSPDEVPPASNNRKLHTESVSFGNREKTAMQETSVSDGCAPLLSADCGQDQQPNSHVASPSYALASEEETVPAKELPEVRESHPDKRSEASAGKRAQQYWDRLIAEDMRNRKPRRVNKVAGSLYAGNFGTLKGDLHTSDPDRAASAGMLIKQTSDKGTTLHSGLHEDNGRPVLAPGQPLTREVNLHHRMPLNVGLTLSIPLNDRLALKTGLNYSYLYSSSDQAFTAGNAIITRELHYIGVPVSLSYTFYRAGNFSFYVQGGGMAEKAVAWRETQSFATSEDSGKETLSLKVRGVQFSVNATAGLSYDFNRHIGLYIEPGVAYYFGHKEQPASYRTVHPASFSIRCGLKFGI